MPIPGPVADVGTLQAFVAIARLGTVGRAAEALGRTQPSISARLTSLETAWGTRLFRREARGMALTPEGARLLPRAEAALATLEELDRNAGLPVAGPDQVRVGAGDALGRVVLPRALRELTRETPGMGVRILEGPGAGIVGALRRGEIDIAFVVSSGPIVPDDDLDGESLFESPVDLLVPTTFRVRGTRSISPRILADERVVTLQPGSRFRRHVESALSDLGLSFEPAVEVGNLSLVRRFVSAGLGVGPVPAIAFADGEPGPRIIRRRLTRIPPVTYLRIIRRGVPLSAPTLRLLELIRRAAMSR